MTAKPIHPLWLPGVLKQYRDAVKIISKMMPRILRRVYDAEDFVQMAICDMLDHPGHYDKEAKDPKHIMVLIAERRMIDALRRRPNRTSHLQIDNIVLEFIVIERSWGCGPVKTPAEIAELHDSYVYAMIRTLDPRERMFLTLRSHGYMFNEAVSMIGMGERTLLRRLESLRSRVRIHIG